MDEKNYLVIQTFGLDFGELETEAAKLIADGFRPQGGPFIVGMGTGTVRLAQAMFRDQQIADALNAANTILRSKGPRTVGEPRFKVPGWLGFEEWAAERGLNPADEAVGRMWLERASRGPNTA